MIKAPKIKLMTNDQQLNSPYIPSPIALESSQIELKQLPKSIKNSNNHRISYNTHFNVISLTNSLDENQVRGTVNEE